jgi:hypothetical protein
LYGPYYILAPALDTPQVVSRAWEILAVTMQLEFNS